MTRTGASDRTIRRWREDDLIGVHKRADGVWLYHVGDCLEQQSKGKRGGAALALPAAPSGPTEAVLLVEQSYGHIKDLFAPHQISTSLLAEENQRLRADNARLQKKNLKMLDKHEQNLSKTHKRMMKQQGFENQQHRKTELFKQGLNYLPLLVNAVAARFTAGNAASQSDIQEGLLSGIFENATDEQMANFCNSNSFDMPTIALIMELRQKLRDERDARDARDSGGAN